MRPVPAANLRYRGITKYTTAEAHCYCCGTNAIADQATRLTYWGHTCPDCGGQFVRRHGLVVFDCPAHGLQLPVQIRDEDVIWWKRDPTQKTVSVVKTVSGKKVSLLTWEETNR